MKKAEIIEKIEAIMNKIGPIIVEADGDPSVFEVSVAMKVKDLKLGLSHLHHALVQLEHEMWFFKNFKPSFFEEYRKKGWEDMREYRQGLQLAKKVKRTVMKGRPDVFKNKNQ